MMLQLCAFELKRRLRMPGTLLCAAAFCGLSCLFFLYAGGAFSGGSLSVGDGTTWVNAPPALHQLFIALHIQQLIFVAALFGGVVHQDLAGGMGELVFTLPVSRRAYLAGRFLAATVAAVLLACTLPLGAWIASVSPLVDARLFGPVPLVAWLWPLAVSLVPNVFVIGAFSFSLAALTRRIMPVYLGAVLLVAGYLAAAVLLGGGTARPALCLLEPFGSFALNEACRSWSAAWRNTHVIPLQGVGLANRLFWVGLAAASLVVTFRRFRPGPGTARARAELPEATSLGTGAPARLIVQPTGGGTGTLAVWARLTRFHLTAVTGGGAFRLMLLCGLLFAAASAFRSSAFQGMALVADTWLILQKIGGAFALFLIVILTFAAGDMVWRDRDAGMGAVVDALPPSGAVRCMAALSALWGLLLLLLGCMACLALVVTVLRGGRVNLGLILTYLFYFRLVEFGLYTVLALTVHTLVHHKTAAHGLLVLYFPAILLMPSLGFEDPLIRLMDTPAVVWSSLTGFAPSARAFNLIAWYWTGVGGCCIAAAALFWARGSDLRLRTRLRRTRRRLTYPVAALGLMGLITAGLTGGRMYGDTHLSNRTLPVEDTHPPEATNQDANGDTNGDTHPSNQDTHLADTNRDTHLAKPVTTSAARERRAAAYERTYRNHPWLPQVTVTALDLQVDVHPATGSLTAAGTYRFVVGNQPLTHLLLSLPDDVRVDAWDVPGGADETCDAGLGVSLLALSRPLAVGESGSLGFRVSLPPQSGVRSRRKAILPEAAVFSDALFLPTLGFDARRCLTRAGRRARFDLGPPPQPSRQAWHVRTRISTAPGHTAVAPGRLLGQTVDDGRPVFLYETDHVYAPGLGFASTVRPALRDTSGSVTIEAFPLDEGADPRAALALVGRGLAAYERRLGPFPDGVWRVVVAPRSHGRVRPVSGMQVYGEGTAFLLRQTGPAPLPLARVLAGAAVATGLDALDMGTDPLLPALNGYLTLAVLREADPAAAPAVLQAAQRRFAQDSTARNAGGSGDGGAARGALALNACETLLGAAFAPTLQTWAGTRPEDRASLAETLTAVAPPDVAPLVAELLDGRSFWNLRIDAGTVHADPAGLWSVALTVSAEKMDADGGVPVAVGTPITVAAYRADGTESARATAVPEGGRVTLAHLETVPARVVLDPDACYVERVREDNTWSPAEVRRP